MALPQPPPPVRACLFDMDGLLIDSEELYTLCTNEVLRKYGKPDLPWHIKAQMQGRPGPSAGVIFQQWAQLPISREEVQAEISALQRKHFPSCGPLPGVPELLETLSGLEPNVAIALATSSHVVNFRLKTDHLKQLFSVFKEDQKILGDDTRIPAGRGKPAPDIYLLALSTVNANIRAAGGKEIEPAECLVFEDSVPGVESGRRAGMQVVWCPHPGLLEEYAGREEEVLAGLTGEHKEEIPPVIETAGQRVTGGPGAVNDGYATFMPNLVNFPYEKFGIKA